MNAPIDISTTIIKTQRLILRPWEEKDLDDLYEYASIDGVGQMAGWLPHESKDASKRILDSFMQGKKTFAIEFESKVIGSLGVERYKETAYPELDTLQGRELGYVLSKDYWGQGLMPEAVKSVIAYLFEEEKLDFIIISHFIWNNRSRRVIEKCGLRYVKNSIHETHFGTKEETREYILYNTERRD